MHPAGSYAGSYDPSDGTSTDSLSQFFSTMQVFFILRKNAGNNCMIHSGWGNGYLMSNT